MAQLNLRTIAAGLAIAAGIAELLIIIMIIGAAAPVKGAYAGIFLYILPLAMMAGGVIIALRPEAYLGAGVVLISFAILHFLSPLRAGYMIPMILAGLAVAIALRIDRVERRDPTATA